MTPALLTAQIAGRLAQQGLVVSDSSVAALARYVEHLSHWNRRVNLTAIPLGPPLSNEAIDKLLVEPILATTLVDASPRTWFDLGSGSGSPAIPLRIVWRAGSLTMVESRERKGAFLREAVRQLNLSATAVATCRFEELPASGSVDVVTLRAVRIDAGLISLLSRLLSPSGLVLAFGGSIDAGGFTLAGGALLPDGSELRLFRRGR